MAKKVYKAHKINIADTSVLSCNNKDLFGVQNDEHSFTKVQLEKGIESYLAMDMKL